MFCSYSFCVWYHQNDCGRIHTLSNAGRQNSVSLLRGVKLGHVKNTLFGVLTIALYTSPKSAFYALFGVMFKQQREHSSHDQVLLLHCKQYRVATRQGKVREVEIFSRSGNCQGI